MKEFVELYQRVIDFNTKGGVKDELYDTPAWWSQVELQSKLLVEEAQETLNGAVYGDKKELLDGCIDTLVIVFKLADMLEKAGFNVVEAFEAICSNNDSKIFNSYYEAVEEKVKLENLHDTEYTVDTSICNGMPYYTIKRFDGKIVKRIGFKAVDIDSFVPR